jgi:hypothetical protein
MQVFPNPAVNYDLNWSLNDDDVTPHGETFRNPPVNVLLGHCAAGKKASHAGLPAPKAAKAVSVLSTDPAGGLDLDGFDEKFTEVRARVWAGGGGGGEGELHSGMGDDGVRALGVAWAGLAQPASRACFVIGTDEGWW